MKLLTKNQITEVKNKERQLDIEQGLNFARKIDVLRETREKEEASLDLFRTQTLESVKKEIDSLISKRDLLYEEVKTLDEKKLIALKPLTEEWNQVKDRENQLTILERSLSEAFIKSEANKVYLFQKEKEIAKSFTEIEQKLEATDRAYREMILDRENARKLLEENKIKANAAISDASSKLKDALQREIFVGAREYNANIRDKNQDRREVELNSRERSIVDRYETLERTIKRKNG